MRLFMDFVFGLGQVLVRTLWVKSVGSAHWLVRQWVISVTELSLDLKADKWQKSGWSLHCFWKSELWFRQDNERQICEKTFLYTLVVGGFGRHFFEQVLLESLEYSTSCNTQVTLDWTRIWAKVSMVWSTTAGPLGGCVHLLRDGITKNLSLFPYFPIFMGKCHFQGNKEM